MFNEERVSFRRCGSKEDGWMIDGPKQKGVESIVSPVELFEPNRSSFASPSSSNFLWRAATKERRGIDYTSRRVNSLQRCVVRKMSSIQILGPLVPSLPLQVLPEEKQYAVEGAPTLKTSSRRRRRWKISLSLSSPVSRSFFSILSRIFPRKLKSCLFLSFNNSWGLGRGSGGQGCELDLCELLFLRARERERRREFMSCGCQHLVVVGEVSAGDAEDKAHGKRN